MSCKTKPCQSLRESLRMVRVMSLDSHPILSINIRPKNGSYRATKHQKLQTNCKIYFFTKTCFFTILNCIWEVWGCPGGGHGPYDAIPSNFGRVWSYMAWGMVLGPPDWSSFLFESQGTISGTITPINLPKQIPPKKKLGIGQPPQIIFC